jgi:hypothetical protein
MLHNIRPLEETRGRAEEESRVGVKLGELRKLRQQPSFM